VFVASTFLTAAAPLGQLLGNDDLVRPLSQLDPMAQMSGMASYKWWEEPELRDLCDQVKQTQPQTLAHRHHLQYSLHYGTHVCFVTRGVSTFVYSVIQAFQSHLIFVL
jgi:hypothetical protein